MSWTVALLGGGALGSLYAVELGRRGVDVTVVSRRADVVERIRHHGVTVHDRRPGRPVSTATERVGAVTPEGASGPFDVVLVVVKAADVDWAAELAAGLVATDGVVVGLQNGLRSAGVVESATTRGVAGTTYQGAVAEGIATVGWTIDGPTLMAPGPVTAEAARRFSAGVDGAGFHWQIVRDRDAMLWEKLVVAVSNAVSGALALPVHQLLGSSAARQLLDTARREAVAVAETLGVGIDGAALLARLDAATPEGVGATAGSTYQSIVSGRRPEVDDISGALCELGRSVAVPTPVNEVLTRMVEARCEVTGLSG